MGDERAATAGSDGPPPQLRRPFPPPAPRPLWRRIDLRTAGSLLLVAGMIATAWLGSGGERDRFFVVLFLLCGGLQLMSAALLARGMVKPGLPWGHSASGTALQSPAMFFLAASMAGLLEPVHIAIEFVTFAAALVAFFVALRRERRAQQVRG
jgi:hypothetical protein